MDNININNGKASLYSAVTPAWHKLGTVTKERLKSDEVITISGLDYEVSLERVYFSNGSEYNEIKNYYSTVRKDTNVPLGIVGSKYNVVQNKFAFNFFDALVGDKMAIYETAGALGNGETIFLLAKLPDSMLIDKDLIDNYLLFTNTHDGSRSIQVMYTPIRVVCQNTLNAAISSGIRKHNIRHTASAEANLNKALEILKKSYKAIEIVKPMFETLHKTPISDNNVTKYLAKLFLDKEEYIVEQNRVNLIQDNVSTRKLHIFRDITDYYHNGIGQKEIVGTLYGAYNTVSGYYHNLKNFTDDNKKLNSLWFGDGYSTSQKALELALEFVNNPEVLEV